MKHEHSDSRLADLVPLGRFRQLLETCSCLGVFATVVDTDAQLKNGKHMGWQRQATIAITVLLASHRH